MKPTSGGEPGFAYPHTSRTVSRVGGLMLLAGGGISIAITLGDPAYANGHPVVIFGVSGLAAALGVLCLALPDRMPRWLLYLLPLIGTGLICMSMLLSRTPSDGSELLLVWPVLFAGYFLPRLAAWLSLCAVIGMYSPIALSVLGRAGLGPSVNLAGTSLITLLIMASLRSRITELLGASQAEARTDGLTGVRNRRAFDELLAREVARCARQVTPLSLLMIDLDHFKQLNDKAGHPAGDATLQRVATLLQARARQTDTVARLGGEEFALLLPGCPPAEAAAFAEGVRVFVRGESGGWPHSVTVSIGVASFPSDATRPDELLALADGALYAAKAAGRNTVCVATASPVRVGHPRAEADVASRGHAAAP